MGGAFQLADTMGVPLWFSLEQAEIKKSIISLPHYFASAMESGWDDVQTFGKIQEALTDAGQKADIEKIKFACITLFIEVSRTMPGKSAMEIGRKMREDLEADALARLWEKENNGRN